MPVILHDDDYERWLTAPVESVLGAGCAVSIAAYGVIRMNGAGRGCEVEVLPSSERVGTALCPANLPKKLSPHSNPGKTPTSKPGTKGLRRSTAVVRTDQAECWSIPPTQQRVHI